MNDYYQGLADSLGLPLNGVWSKDALARRAHLDALGDAEADSEPPPTKTHAVTQPAPRTVEPKAVSPRPLARPALLTAPMSFHFSWAACVHEASHAVAALALGGRVHRVTVCSDCYAARDPMHDTHAEAVVILAGSTGEAFLTESRTFLEGQREDMRRLAALGLSDSALSLARQEATRIVCEHRDAIGRIAHELSRWGVASGEEVSLLFRLNNGG